LREEAWLDLEEEVLMESGDLSIEARGIGESRPARQKGSVGDSGGIAKSGIGKQAASFSFLLSDRSFARVLSAIGGLARRLPISATEAVDAFEVEGSKDVRN